jgi:hypothetical protein
MQIQVLHFELGVLRRIYVPRFAFCILRFAFRVLRSAFNDYLLRNY